MMPPYLLEEFHSSLARAQEWSDFKVYFSILGWYGNTGFCFAAALGKLKGAKIVACQCGGGYGQYETFHPEMIERRFSDFYITWGWNDSHYSGAQLLPLPQPHLSTLAKHENQCQSMDEKALWIGTAIQKHPIRLMKNVIPTSSLDIYTASESSFATWTPLYVFH